MKEIRATVSDEVYERFNAFKKIRHDRTNGPPFETLVDEKYKREKAKFDEVIKEMREANGKQML
jgi:predicted CopG family antitoxin